MIVVDTHAVIWMTQEQEYAFYGSPLSTWRKDGWKGGLAIADITLREIAVQVMRGRVAVSTPLGGLSALHRIATSECTDYRSDC